jgi:mono/diheme cytochrome c family protein
VTEIPEHLLKRSRERRSALGLGGDGGGATESAPAASATPATTSSATPAAAAPSAPAGRAAAPSPAAPPPPKPDSPVVAAYKRRKKIPAWAMLALSLLPIWAFMYARAVTTQAVEATGPLATGEEAYGTCASCHGGDGGGGVGYAFAGGEVLKTFPHIEDMLRYVYYGTEQYNLAGVEIYGDPNRDGGPHLTGARAVMPNQGAATGGALTDYEVLGVVCHERYTLGGADPGGEYAEEYETWCSEESEIFADLEAGGDIRTLEERFPDIIPIGMAPVPGSPAGE